MNEEFRKELESLLNKHGKDSDLNTPDYILAGYLVDCLASFDWAIRRRDHQGHGHFKVTLRAYPELITDEMRAHMDGDDMNDRGTPAGSIE